MDARFTDFADYTDLVSYIRKAETFLTEAQREACLAVGDNGVGASGQTTANDSTPMVALPAAEIRAKWGSTQQGWGRKVKVTVAAVQAFAAVADIAPPGVCDMNPALLRLLGLKHPFAGPGEWEWVD